MDFRVELQWTTRFGSPKVLKQYKKRVGKYIPVSVLYISIGMKFFFFNIFLTTKKSLFFFLTFFFFGGGHR